MEKYILVPYTENYYKFHYQMIKRKPNILKK